MCVLGGRKHVAVRKGQAINGVVRNIIPVNQFIHHVLIGAERQNPRHDLHCFAQIFRQQLPLRCLMNGLACIGFEFCWYRFIAHDVSFCDGLILGRASFGPVDCILDLSQMPVQLLPGVNGARYIHRLAKTGDKRC